MYPVYLKNIDCDSIYTTYIIVFRYPAARHLAIKRIIISVPSTLTSDRVIANGLQYRTSTGA